MSPPRFSAAWWRRLLLRGVLLGWAAILLTIGSALMASHWVPLTLPDLDDPRLLQAVAGERTDDRWLALHVLYGDCPCSRRVLDHLADRGPRQDTDEVIILLDGTAEMVAPLEGAGFAVRNVPGDDLQARYGLDAAPAFVVADATGTVRWRGGYTDRKQGPGYRDMEILDDLHMGRMADLIPLFGCAVSASLQDIVDPFGTKKWMR